MHLGHVQAAVSAALGFENIHGVLVAFKRRRQTIDLRLKRAQVIPDGSKLRMMTSKAFSENAQRFSIALLGFGQVVHGTMTRSAAVKRHALTNLGHFKINDRGAGGGRKLRFFGRRCYGRLHGSL